MRIAELLTELRKLDAHVKLDGDRLRLNAPAGVLTDKHRHELKSRKQEIVDFLRAAQQLASQQRSLIPLTPKGGGIPIFAVAGHNGDVFCYRAIAEHLGSDQTFFGLQPPGLEEGSEPRKTIVSLAEYFADQIHQIHPRGPVTVAGFCAGGTVAFELARQLKAMGTEVRNLVLFGAPYPTSYRMMPRLAATATYLAQRSIVHTRALLTAPADERRRYFSDRLKVLQPAGEAQQEDPVLLRRSVVEIATLEAVRGYRPSFFDGHLDLMLPSASWRASFFAPLRWKPLARTTAEFVGSDDCDGDTMLLTEHAATFAAFVKQAQEKAQKRTTE